MNTTSVPPKPRASQRSLQNKIKRIKKRNRHLEKMSTALHQRLEQNEIYLSNIMHNTEEHLYLLDPDGVILACNIPQALALGYQDPVDVIGKNAYDILRRQGIDNVDAIRANNLHVLHSQKPQRQEEIAFLHGEKRIFSSYKSPLRNKHNKIIGILGFSIDITDRKKAAEAVINANEKTAQANRAKHEFLMNIQHDLRTPFSGILGLSEVLSLQEIDPEKKAYLDCITQSSRTLLNIMNDIIAITSSEQYTMPLKYDSFSVQELIDGIQDLLSAALKNRQLTFDINIQNAPERIHGDRERIHSILLNLLSNAIKFTEKGGVQLTINTNTPPMSAADPAVAKEISIQVSDTGSGIPDDKLTVIFEKFVKLKPSYSSDNYIGTGLGLSLVKKIVEDLKGTIQVQSQVGVGTTFTCVIPINTSPAIILGAEGYSRNAISP